MGAGRKTFTYDADTRVDVMYNFENNQRNLQDDLGGCIFGCTNDTYNECVEGKIFGLPKAHWCYVQYIQRGMPIFLFNYQSRELHGIFRAVTDGSWRLNPKGWTGGRDSDTAYPSQVQVELYSKCPPLKQAEYAPIIKNCYYNDNRDGRGKFCFELLKSEAQQLCRAFDRAAGHVNATTRPQPVPSAAPAAASDAAGSQAAATSKAPVGAQASSSRPQPAAKQAPAASAAAAAKPGRKPAAPLPSIAEDGWEVVGGSKPGASTSNAWASVAKGKPANREVEKEPAAPPTPPETPKAAKPNSSAARSVREEQKAAPMATDPPSAASKVSGASANGDAVTNIAAVHAAVSQVDNTSADALWHCLTTFSTQIQAVNKRNEMLQQGINALKLENNVLHQELSSLRREVAKVGQAANVPVAAETPGLSNFRTQPFGSSSEVMYLLGGHNAIGWLDSMLVFDPSQNSVTDSGQMPFTCGYGGAAVIGRSVYIIGGGDGTSWLTRAARFDTDTMEWFQLTDMHEARGSLAVASLDDHIFAVGGGCTLDSGPMQNHRSVEVFDPNINGWVMGPEMAYARFTTACVEVGGALYVCGGFDGTQYLNSTERLDPRTGAWQPVANMVQKRGSHVCTVVDNDIYSIGGWDAADYLAGVEVYDVRKNAWREVAPMTTTRAYGAAATVNGAVYTLGGMLNHESHNTSVERYDVSNDVWIQEAVPTEEPIRRAFLSSCLVNAV